MTAWKLITADLKKYSVLTWISGVAFCFLQNGILWWMVFLISIQKNCKLLRWIFPGICTVGKWRSALHQSDYIAFSALISVQSLQCSRIWKLTAPGPFLISKSQTNKFQITILVLGGTLCDLGFAICYFVDSAISKSQINKFQIIIFCVRIKPDLD